MKLLIKLIKCIKYLLNIQLNKIMAITKIHPIKSTLNLSIKYISSTNKTDEKFLITTGNCFLETAHTQFLNTRMFNNVNGSVLARHLIQSFLPNEVSPEIAHEIGKSLCKKILNDNYEFILSTHIDKTHIHNHIIFNNVSFKTGKCYQSNKRSYHKIRKFSDELCKENGLCVIDEFYEKYKKQFKTKGKSYFEYKILNKNISWKSKLQFDIDRSIEKSNTWEKFLDLMKSYGYEIKFGKHISFKHKDKERFTRSKTIGEDYTEEKLKERINSPKTIKEILDLNKINSKYRNWAKKQNLHTMSKTLIELRNQNINSASELEIILKNDMKNLLNLKDEIINLEKEISHLSKVMECIHTVNTYRRNNLTKQNNYKTSLKFLKQHYSKIPTTKEIFEILEIQNGKRNTLLSKYSKLKNNIYKLSKFKKNHTNYLNLEFEK